jgi:CBS domain-containing protein
MRTAEAIVKEKNRPMICVPPDVTVWEALKIMADNQIGAILIREGETIVGIYTERDLLMDMTGEEFDPKSARIVDYMRTDLPVAGYDEPIYQLQDKFLGRYRRYLLIVREGRTVGLLSAGDVTRASLDEASRELKSVSWEYYENWRWKKPSR